jgi:Tfp pilus assembly protein PilX
MLTIILLCILILLILVLYTLRHMLIKSLRTSTRDVNALLAMKRALNLICADENTVKFDPSRDRKAYIPGESRRKKVKVSAKGRATELEKLRLRLKQNTKKI